MALHATSSGNGAFDICRLLSASAASSPIKSGLCDNVWPIFTNTGPKPLSASRSAAPRVRCGAGSFSSLRHRRTTRAPTRITAASLVATEPGLRLKNARSFFLSKPPRKVSYGSLRCFFAFRASRAYSYARLSIARRSRRSSRRSRRFSAFNAAFALASPPSSPASQLSSPLFRQPQRGYLLVRQRAESARAAQEVADARALARSAARGRARVPGIPAPRRLSLRRRRGGRETGSGGGRDDARALPHRGRIAAAARA